MDISIIIPSLNEEYNLKTLIPEIKDTVSKITRDFEIIVVDGNSVDGTKNTILRYGVRFIQQHISGYGAALKEGFRAARGNYILTMDADYSHKPLYIKDLWKNRHRGELIIASRYVKGGIANMPIMRKFLSIVLNRIYTWILLIPYKDISSGYRMYDRRVLEGMTLTRRDFSILEEILIKIHCGGWRIKEIPFYYHPRERGRSNARLGRLAISYLITLWQMWRLRNTVFSADYDCKAYYSRIPLQRYWQRKRYNIIMGFMDRKGGDVLDVGCGSSKIIQDLPKAIGVDINKKSLRFLRNKGHNRLMCSSIMHLPFKDERFSNVICSQVVEHIPKREEIFCELLRVIQKGGTLIIGTPDYNRISWRFFEWISKKIMPGGHLDVHHFRYTGRELVNILKEHNLQIESVRYVMGSEIIIKARRHACQKAD